MKNDNTLFKNWWFGAIYQILTVAQINLNYFNHDIFGYPLVGFTWHTWIISCQKMMLPFTMVVVPLPLDFFRRSGHQRMKGHVKDGGPFSITYLKKSVVQLPWCNPPYLGSLLCLRFRARVFCPSLPSCSHRFMVLWWFVSLFLIFSSGS